MLAPADIFCVSLLVDHARHYPTSTACPLFIRRPSTVLYLTYPVSFPQPDPGLY
ncbi:hypothetical protein GGD63_002279 [Bradyrhizobium sp. cir1]|nr:hypothetical protein [Bradyrhizobium sp. cir1]